MDQKIIYNLDELPAELLEKFVEDTYIDLMENAKIILMDGPKEEHPDFDWVYEIAFERFKNKYQEKGFVQ